MWPATEQMNKVESQPGNGDTLYGKAAQIVHGKSAGQNPQRSSKMYLQARAKIHRNQWTEQMELLGDFQEQEWENIIVSLITEPYKFWIILVLGLRRLD